LKILIVDDDLICRTILAAILEKFGDVHCCDDGASAVEACYRAMESGHAYELICMDIMMPHLNGVEALALIREDEHRRGRGQLARIIMTTAVGDPTTIGNAFGALCDGYLLKPIHPHDLVDLVNCLLPPSDVESGPTPPLAPPAAV
jgi:two-component system chemotaxis response regulator CheY